MTNRIERARIRAILTSPEAEGCREQAEAFAFATDMPAEQAVALLAKAPKSGAAKIDWAGIYAARRAACSGTAEPASASSPRAGLDPEAVYARRKREAAR